MTWESAIAAGVGFLIGASAGWHRWLLYSAGPEDRRRARLTRASSKRELLLALALGTAAAVLAAIAFRPGHYEPWPAAWTAGFGIILVVAAAADMERRRIPNRVTYPAIVAAALCSWGWPDRTFANVWLGMLVAAGVMLTLYAVGLWVGRGRAAIGAGDVKLAVLGGLLVGWPAVLFALAAAGLAGGLAAVALLARQKRHGLVVYGPGLVIGFLVPLMFPDLIG